MIRNPSQQGFKRKRENKLKILDDVLYFTRKDGTLLAVVPQTSRNDLIKTYHEVDGGHSGIDKTFNIIRNKFYWPNMYNNVYHIVSSCDICQKIKKPTYPHKARLIPIIPSSKFESWQTDILGPLPSATTGNRYVIIFIDQFTKWVEAFAFETIDAETVIKCLTYVISRFGVPKRLHSDQGPQYESHKLTEFCNALNIIKSHSSVYHPEGNGLAERAIQTFKQKLKALVNGNPDSWDEKIEEVLWAMRNTYGKATGYTPAELVFRNYEILMNSNENIYDKQSISSSLIIKLIFIKGPRF
ncbi:Pro-Pol polyprotein [Thelohanellus kitauei]|uniref:Pro-Pol polyprotein n=1 Tax=Thelohanellus kitauei TaxID=669202 RepID=A0A0C2IAF7_THEKT|nr:Pro-Pol polyprotein [Thelohanellus kitauei]